MKKLLLLLLSLLILLTNADARFWTNKEGGGFEGELVELKGSNAVIKRNSDGKIFQVSIADLSFDDQKYLDSGKSENKSNKYDAGKFPKSLYDKLVSQYTFDDKDRLNFDEMRNRNSANNPPVRKSKDTKHFNGLIDEWLFFKDALTEDEVKELYESYK